MTLGETLQYCQLGGGRHTLLQELVDAQEWLLLLRHHRDDSSLTATRAADIKNHVTNSAWFLTS